MLLRWWWRALLALVVLVPATAMVVFTPRGLERILFERNFRPVASEVYRSAQPTAADLEGWTRDPGIRSVLSLRRPHPGSRWYEEETRFVAERGLSYQTVPLSGEHLPSPAELHAIVAFLDTAPRPLLLHCSAGVERSGLGAAIVVLLEGGTPARAREEFHSDRGFLEWLGISDLPHFVDRYAEWLRDTGQAPSAERFRTWALEVYAPYFYRAQLDLLERSETRAAFRVTNRSSAPIPLREGAPGVRLGAHWTPAGGSVRELRGDVVHADLAPGASVEIGLTLPPRSRAGILEVDLVHEGRKWFGQEGSPTLAIPLPPP